MSEILFAALLAAIGTVESADNHLAINPVDGHSASYGTYAVKLSTARFMGFKGHITELWFNKEVNKKYAAAYLTYQVKRYKDVKKGLLAYNAGSYKVGMSNTYLCKVYAAAKKSTLSKETRVEVIRLFAGTCVAYK